MKIHRLRVRDVKGVAAHDVTFPDSGVLVVEGPNQAGNTTMVEALDMLLEHKDSSARAQIREAKPVDRDAAPFVEVEMSTGPYRFTYRKRWLKGTLTELELHRPAAEHVTGVPAHERVRAMLAETVDMDLWRALRHLQADPLVPCDLSGSTALASALDAAAGTARDAGTRGESILAAAEQEYLTYFTAKAGLPTLELKRARERLAAAAEVVRATAAALAEVADDVERHDRLRREAAALRARLRDARLDRDARRVEVERVAVLTRAHEQACRRCEDADRDLERAAASQRERADLVAEVSRRRDALAVHLRSADDCRLVLDEADARTAALETAARQAVEDEERTRAAAEAADRARERARAAEQLETLRRRLERAEAARVRHRSARRAVREARVTEGTLRAVEAAARALDVAHASQLAGSAQVELDAGPDGGDLLVDGEAVALAGGERWSRSLGEPVEVRLPGGWRLRLWPEEGAAGRAAQVAAARRELTDLLAAADVDGVEEARAAAERHRSAVADLDRAEEELADACAGEDLEELRERHECLTAQVDAGTETRAAEGDPAALRAAAADSRAAARAAATRCEQARRHGEELRVALTRAESLAGVAREELTLALARLARGRAAAGDADLAAALTAAREQVADARAVRAARGGDLEAADVETVQILAEEGAAACEGLERRLAELGDEQVRLEARLEQAGAQGRHERDDEARTELDAARRDLDALDRHAQAARLLRETLQTHSRAVKRAYVAPFRAALDRLGRIVYGPGFAVEVGDDLTVLARTLDGRRIPFAALSTGAREQLAILTRLACAAVVDPREGVPVVIDDALGYSDPDRLRRMCAAFGRIGSDAQVLLLTCTPGRYAAVGAASVVRI